MSQPPKKKSQHYVPQTYLRGFARAEAPNSIFVYDLVLGKSFPAGIADVGQARYFHDFPAQHVRPEDDPQLVENFLAEHVEGPLGNALRVIAATVEKEGVTHNHRVALSFYTMLQAVRTADFRSGFEALFSAGSTRLTEYAEQTGFPGEIPDLTALDSFTTDLAPVWHAALLTDPAAVAKLARPLLNHVLYVAVNDTEFPFWTSDDPVARYSHDPDRSIWGGVNSSGSEVLFPVNRRLLAVFLERTYAERNFASRAELDGQIVRVDIDQVKYFNAQQVAQCARQVYSPTDDFSLIEEIREKQPEALERAPRSADDLLGT